MRRIITINSNQVNKSVETKKILTEKLENRGFKYIHNTLAGGTISSHCGPNCIGVLFLNK